MKRLVAAVVVGIMAVCLFGTTALADDPINVDIVVVGDGPVVTVNADGDDPSVFINGQDIQEPTVIKKNYGASTRLKNEVKTLGVLLGETSANLAVTSDGLVNALLAIGEHTSNLRELLGLTNQNAENFTNKDKELTAMQENQDSAILQLDNDLTELRGSLEEYVLSASEAVNSLTADYQTKLAELNAKVDANEAQLHREYNTKLFWTWGVLGAIGLLLGIRKLWQIRLGRD